MKNIGKIRIALVKYDTSHWLKEVQLLRRLRGMRSSKFEHLLKSEAIGFTFTASLSKSVDYARNN